MTLVFGILVVLATAIVVVSAISLSRVISTNETLLEGDVANLINAERLRSTALEKSFEVRGYLLTGDGAFIAASERADAQFDDAMRAMRARAGAREMQLLADIERAMATYQSATEPLIGRRLEADGLAAVIGTFRERLAPAFATLNERIVDYVDDRRADLADSTAAAQAEAVAAERVLLGVGGAAIVAALVLAVLLTRTVTRQIGSSVQHVRSSSTELQAAATQQASGAKEQATAMSEISMTITELLTTSRQIASSAQQVATVAEQTADGTTAGRGAIHDAERAMATIKQQVETIAQRMLEVGKKSQQIGGILSIINELSEQTNILAINATIEAASAGEAGKRFAVVGDEVRKLAERVGGSSKQVRTLIEEMREAVNATVMVTETHSKAVEAGVHTFARLTTVFDGIAGAVDTTKDVAREIELSTKQQTSAVEQVNVAIADAAQATREAETGSSQTLQTASQLADLSDQLLRIIQSAAPARA